MAGTYVVYDKHNLPIDEYSNNDPAVSRTLALDLARGLAARLGESHAVKNAKTGFEWSVEASTGKIIPIGRTRQ